MDRHDIIEEALGRIDPEYAEAAARKMNRKGRKPAMTPAKRTALIAAAAMLAAALIGGGIFAAVSRDQKKTVPLSTSALLATLTVTSTPQTAGRASAFLPFGDRVALYSSVYLPEDEPEYAATSRNEKVLRQYQGELYYEGATKWYMVEDSVNLQTLIREDADGRLSVWQFSCFQTWGGDRLQAEFPDSIISDYEYRTLLAALYHVDSSDDIARIEILPVTGYRYQNGQPRADIPETIVVKTRKDIEGIYEILKKMTCYGTGSLVDHAEPVISQELQNLLMADSSRQSLYERDVRLVLQDGTTIEGLKYSAVWGSFYEQGGIAYGGLTPADVETMNYYADIRTN